MPLVLSTGTLHEDAARALDQIATLRIVTDTTRESLVGQARDADIIIVRAPPVPEDLFDTATRLRAVIRHGAGVDMIPVDAATRAGVLVANVPGANARAVAEYVMLTALALARRLRQVDTDLRNLGWFAGRRHAVHTRELSGGVVGLVGTGNVGRAVAAIAANGFGMEVLGYNPRSAPSDPIIHRAGLTEVAAASDVVVVSCPLTPETEHLIDAEFLAAMKPNAVLINAARGPVLVESALITALQTGQLAGAALDVFQDQPLPPGHPLLGLENLILTPHLAGITDDSMARMGMAATAEAARVLSGELPANLVNPDAVHRYRERIAALD